MMRITIGRDQQTGKPISIPSELFRTHFHLLGATGTGKTTAIHTLLHPILMETRPQKNCVFIVDPMGNLSYDLLKWIASRRYCPDHVRQRLVYIEPAREDVVLPFNPLIHSSQDHLYYQAGRAVEIVLRAWASQDIEQMPRLRLWTFNSFFAVAALGYPIAVCRFLLRPGTPEHQALLQKLPPELQAMWAEILQARGSEAVRILESTRNRLAPFFDSGILRRMFGVPESRFDVRRFIEERRIVILNVASYNRLDPHIGHTIGGLAVNEIIQTARNMSPKLVDPTYLLLDEFQHFVGEDLYEALPIVRQLGLRLILAHQSFDQLERGDLDLSGMIWQARSRLMFANDAEDADLIAHELATLTYDPMKLKEVLYRRGQRIAGHRREWVQNFSKTSTVSDAIDTQEGQSTSQNRGESRKLGTPLPTEQAGRTTSSSRGRSEKHATSAGESAGRSETLVPIHEDFLEVSSKTYSTFDEERTQWAKRIREKRTGEAFGKFKDDPTLYDIAITRHPQPDGPAIEQAVEELLEQNFASEFFVSSALVEQESEQLRVDILRPPVIRIAGNDQSQASGNAETSSGDPFTSGRSGDDSD